MKIGFVGLGKLGLPVALAIESKGHEVCGYDVNPDVARYVAERDYPFQEDSVNKLLETSKLAVLPGIPEVVEQSDIVFVPVQTPHESRFEGTERLPAERADFDYSHLAHAIGAVAGSAAVLRKHTVVAVISTCLPGTFERELRPLLNEWTEYVYTPQFIAMGTVVADYLNPEFALIGVESLRAAQELRAFYDSLFDKPHVVTDITTAEGIKVSYNTWVTAKTVIANLWGELAERLGMNFGDIHKAWSLATDRLISSKYMDAGMGDGGGCHPRDNIAMSHLARQVGLSHDIFEDLMVARQDLEAWHAEVAKGYADKSGLRLVVLGRAFKPGTQIETGSPAVLMANILAERGAEFVHVEGVEGLRAMPGPPAVYFVATKHPRFEALTFPAGSVVIDPFGFIGDQDSVEVVRLGRR